MTEYMTREEYDKIIGSQDVLDKSLVACAQEISMIEKGRLLEGEWDGDSDIWDDRYLVVFESPGCCGDTDTDSVYVPMEFIYDEGYREYYRKVLIQDKRNREEAVLRRAKQKKTYRLVTDEHVEYERLKKKFGDE